MRLCQEDVCMSHVHSLLRNTGVCVYRSPLVLCTQTSDDLWNVSSLLLLGTSEGTVTYS